MIIISKVSDKANLEINDKLIETRKTEVAFSQNSKINIIVENETISNFHSNVFTVDLVANINNKNSS